MARFAATILGMLWSYLRIEEHELETGGRN
jgi:hypothetical protein